MDPATHNYLNAYLGEWLEDTFGIESGFDRGTMMNPSRRITRPIAQYLHARVPDAIGLRYESRLLDGICVALWPRARLIDPGPEPVTSSNADLQRAGELLNIKIPKF